jgi:uncharacterized protein
VKWQTRYFQGVVPVTVCKFDSCLGHKKSNAKNRIAFFCLTFAAMPIIFIIILLSYIGANVYIFIRGAQAVTLFPTGLKITLAILFWVCVILLFISFFARNAKLPSALSGIVYEVGNSWLIVTLYLFLLLLIFDILKLCGVHYNYGFITSVIITCLALTYGYINYRHPKINNIKITLKDNGQHHLKILAFSDLHLGNGTRKKALQRYVKMINAQHPDIILIGGDLIDNSVAPLYEQNMKEEIDKLKAPLGIYMVPGNHEYYSGINESAKFIGSTQIRLLRDTVLTLKDSLQIIGRDDYTNSSRKSLKELMSSADRGKPTILLDHQPRRLSETQEEGINLQFSGHTHHGQVWPISWITDKIFEQSHGYKKWGNSNIYVSSGLSLFGPPFRIGTQSDIAVFNIAY